jgi:glycosyltransferase involved in cell wall biosynthesis
MKIAIEALGIHYVGGGRTAILSLFEALFAMDPQNQYKVFLSQPEPSLVNPSGNVQQVIAPTRNRFLLRLWAQVYLPFLTRGYDLVHFTKNLAVFGTPAKTIITIHDLTTVFFPKLFNPIDVWYWQHILPVSLRNAQKIVAVSQTTAQDIINFYHMPAEKIQVVYNVLPPYIHRPQANEIEQVRQKYGLRNPYFIHVGRLDKKKNLSFLVEAFADFKKKVNQPFDLVLVGEIYKSSPDENLIATIERFSLQDSVRLLGRAPDADISALNGGASAAVYVSLHEGFGLSPVEAMACGTPVIIHNSGAIGEVVADAAILLDSLTIQTVSDTLTAFSQHPERQADLRAKGLARSQSFSGPYSAGQILNLYESLVRENPGRN